IRFLLNHRSGLVDVFSNPPAAQNWYNTPDSIWNPLDVIHTYNNNPLFSQGSGFNYSNTNYILLGLIIEQVTGNSFAQELSSRILVPYGLSNTFFLPFDSITGTLTNFWTSYSSASGPFTDPAEPILTDCFASMAYTSGA